MEDPSQPSDEREPALSPGTRLGKYEIGRRLGAGGMGAVYEGTHTEIGKRVAIKVLSPAISAIPGARVRFLREAQLTTKVRHPHIVDVTDIGNEGGQAYIVMELLQGEDLSQRLERGPLSPQDLADYLLPVCAAVSAAHRAGITHRDLKPQNIFLSKSALSMQPKVLDFGISKGADGVGAGTLTGTGGVIGTPFYFAPEQILDPKSAGPASDQYALGVIMYECLTGRRPFESDNLFMVFQAIVAGQTAPPRQLRPDLPAALEQVVLRAMSHDARGRFASTDELGRALLPFASVRQRSIWEDGFGPIGPTDGGDSGAPSAQHFAEYESKVTDLITRDATASPPAFLFHVGDVVYFYGEENYYYGQFYEPFKAYPAPIFAIPGNHDGITYNDSMISLDSFQKAFCAPTPARWIGSGGLLRTSMTQPGVYFTLNAPLVSIIGLYSNCGESFGWLNDDQLTFLYNELVRLKGLRKNGLPAVILAIHHFPRWFPDQKPIDPTSAAIDAACKKAGFWPDAVACGHAHLYQRVVRQDTGQDIPYVLTGAGGYAVTPGEEVGKSYMAKIAS